MSKSNSAKWFFIYLLVFVFFWISWVALMAFDAIRSYRIVRGSGWKTAFTRGEADRRFLTST